jgi:uncharacterized repeat protein (TIGR01451 family)
MPPLVDGAIVPPAPPPRDNVEELYNADVEPDADGDGFGDETQDACAQDGTRQTPCAADLALTAATPATSVRFGEIINYDLKVTNLGSSPADAVVLTAITPAGLAITRFTCLGGGPPAPGVPSPIGFYGCGTVSGRLLGALGTLAPGASAGANLRLAATTAGPVVMTASVESSTADPQPGNNAVSVTSTVRLNPGACANVQSGTFRADVLTGTSAGDKLLGQGGNDTVRGDRGADCLDGGPGADQLFGGPGPDKLKGGTGKDTINGGPGNDVIDARDGSVDKVACGPGRDVVKADRRDALTGCERRRR